MDCVALLKTAIDAGLLVSIAGKQLVIRGPKSADLIARRLLLWKSEVIAAIEMQTAQMTSGNGNGTIANQSIQRPSVTDSHPTSTNLVGSDRKPNLITPAGGNGSISAKSVAELATSVTSATSDSQGGDPHKHSSKSALSESCNGNRSHGIRLKFLPSVTIERRAFWPSDLAGWVRSLDASDLPPAPFQLNAWTRVTDSSLFLTWLQQSAAAKAPKVGVTNAIVAANELRSLISPPEFPATQNKPMNCDQSHG